MNDDREHRIANLVIIKYGITHPFDMEEFCRSQSEFILEALPFDLDALLLKKSPTIPRTKMMISSAKPATRRIFTMAHELGHVFIPWHIGEFKCKVSEGGAEFSDIYYRAESEADGFATELIAPKSWVQTEIERGRSPLDIFSDIKSMGTSNLAASRILAARLPPNNIIIETDQETDVINFHYESNGSVMTGNPRRHSLLEDSIYDGLVKASENGIFGRQRITIISVSAPPIEMNTAFMGTSRDALMAIFKDLDFEESVKRRFESSINGICGTAKNLANKNGMPLHEVLFLRFNKRDELKFLINHPLFESFILKKGEEILNKEVGK